MGQGGGAGGGVHRAEITKQTRAERGVQKAEGGGQRAGKEGIRQLAFLIKSLLSSERWRG